MPSNSSNAARTRNCASVNEKFYRKKERNKARARGFEAGLKSLTYLSSGGVLFICQFRVIMETVAMHSSQSIALSPGDGDALHMFDGTVEDLVLYRGPERLAVFEGMSCSVKEVENFMEFFTRNLGCMTPLAAVGTIFDDMGCTHYIVGVAPVDIDAFGYEAMNSRWRGQIAWVDEFLF